MKWVLIGTTHINMDTVKFFYWEGGKLYFCTGIKEKLYQEDPDKKWYHKLCQLMGIRPYEEEAHG